VRKGVWGTGVPSGVQEQSSGREPGGRKPQKLKLFVNECLNFDVLEEKIVKQQKIPSSKFRVG